MNLPEHYSCSIYHNEHKNYYQSVDQYLKENEKLIDCSYHEIKEMIERDEIWEIQLYPLTPISFYKSFASTLEKAIEGIWEAVEKDKK